MPKYVPSVVFVATSEGGVRRVEELNSANSRALNAAEDTIFALTPSGVYDVFTLTMALESESLGISSGETHNVLLSSDGQVYSWGVGALGELGLGPKRTQVDTPELVRLPVQLNSVACGKGYSCGIDTLGNLYSWGQNFSHQLGLYTKPLSQMPPGCLVEDVVMTPRIVPFSVKNSVIKVACGTDFTFAITKVGCIVVYMFFN
jgi:alpha-tubulin suppressor-like RCC1 family protein